MVKSGKNILWLNEISQSDIRMVGGKNAALGEMYNALSEKGIRVPNAFVVTASAYYHFLEEAGIKEKLEDIFGDLDSKNLVALRQKARQARRMILRASWPVSLREEICRAYDSLSGEFGCRETDVAVRASVASEQIAVTSFPGMQETFLGVDRPKDVLDSVKKCFASLFNDHAIVYRIEKNLSLFDIALSVGVQKMVRSDMASSGVAFTVDPESGFQKAVVISSAYGLGEAIVDGRTDPDEFLVFKPALARGYRSIISRTKGRKEKKGVYGKKGMKLVSVSPSKREEFSLDDRDVLLLAQWCVAIEDHYSRVNNRYTPQEIEWAKDGRTGQLFVVQASPESVHQGKKENHYRTYSFRTDQSPLLEGTAVGREVVSGPVRLVRRPRDLAQVKPGDVLVTAMTDFQWVSVIGRAAALVANEGSRTCHAAIISREYGVPSLIGTGRATEELRPGETVTIDNSSGGRGYLYRGSLPFSVKDHDIKKLPPVRPKVALNISRSEGVFHLSALPVSGVGLVREEFVIMEEIKVHPRALCLFDQLDSTDLKKDIEALTDGYVDKKEYFIDKLSQSLGVIAAAFWPRPVVVRLSDLKTSEYRQLIGGELFEPVEANPMMGWRGASRYYHPDFRSVFQMECRAIRRVREDWGLHNVRIMVPFCRTPEEGRRVISLLSEFGLKRGVDRLKIYIMAELPSNIVLADHFLEIFDGFSIGSNDLTQLILGLDRDNPLIQSVGDERHLAVKQMIKEVIEWAQAARKPISLCGEGPVNFPDLALFLAHHHLDTISVAPSAVVPMIQLLAENGFSKNIQNEDNLSL